MMQQEHYSQHEAANKHRKPETLNPELETRNTKLETLNPKPEALDSKEPITPRPLFLEFLQRLCPPIEAKMSGVSRAILRVS